MRAQNTPAGHGPVVVGVDGSRDALAAAHLGAWEAKRRRLPLVLVHGYVDRMPHAHGLMPHRSVVTAVRDDAREMLTQTEARVHAAHPGVAIRSTLTAGGAASSVAELSRGSSLVLVGARGAGGFPELTLGSVAQQVAMHSHAPVIVVRPTSNEAEPAAGPVVVGVDGSAAADEALAFAIDEAAARGAQLVPLYAWHRLPAGNLGPAGMFDFDPAAARQEVSRMLAEAIAGWSEKFPDVPLRPAIEFDTNPAWALSEASRRAGLVVVGGRGRGGFARLLLGSVSQAVLTHAHCSVAIIRAGVTASVR